MRSAPRGQHATRHVTTSCVLAGVPVCLEFQKPTTRRQQEWLLATRVPLRSITFHPDDQVGSLWLIYVLPPSVHVVRRAPWIRSDARLRAVAR